MSTLDPRQVLLEILRNCPNGIGRTKLFKSFYLAHLVFATNAPGLLTDWPIARMPYGPGISDSFELLDPLEANGFLVRQDITDGMYPESVYRLTDKEFPENSLPKAAIDAIRQATQYVLPMSAKQISNETHEHSRSWYEGKNGEILDIYTDLIGDEEYERRTRQLEHLEADLASAMKDEV